MWSHYASNHKGACLIFNKELLTENLPKNFSYHKLIALRKAKKVFSELRSKEDVFQIKIKK
jgi:hypothetical protein